MDSLLQDAIRGFHLAVGRAGLEREDLVKVHERYTRLVDISTIGPIGRAGGLDAP
jgi:hypothetical protein